MGWRSSDTRVWRQRRANVLLFATLKATLRTMFDWEKLLADVVNINSGTANTEGSEKVRKRFTPEFEELGFRAHAGLEHHKGINACVELSHKITQIAELTDYPRKITVSPGVFSGGSTANIVCEHASAKIDVRYVDKNDLEELMKKFRSITETMTGTQRRNERAAQG